MGTSHLSVYKKPFPISLLPRPGTPDGGPVTGQAQPDDCRNERPERLVPVTLGFQRCLEPQTSWTGLSCPKGAGSA